MGYRKKTILHKLTGTGSNTDIYIPYSRRHTITYDSGTKLKGNMLPK
jgi:hypothetical protein